MAKLGSSWIARCIEAMAGQPTGHTKPSCPDWNAFKASSDGVVASQIGVSNFSTQTQGFPNFPAGWTLPCPRPSDDYILFFRRPLLFDCQEAAELQPTAVSPITYWLPSLAIEPVNSAVPSARWQSSRPTVGLTSSLRSVAHQTQRILYLLLGDELQKGRLL